MTPLYVVIPPTLPAGLGLLCCKPATLLHLTLQIKDNSSDHAAMKEGMEVI